MLHLFVIGIMVAVAVARRGTAQYVLDLLVNHMSYNVIAAKDIFMDRIHASSNKTETPKKTGKVAIVTGGSRGIGVEIVRMLLQCDMEVVIACRNSAAGEKAIKEIRERGITTGSARVMVLDNSSLNSVRKFAEEFKNNYTKLDILINNAGIMFTSYGETEDGYENQYGVNYLSHFLLTLLLLPLMKIAGTPEEKARIVNVSSCAHLLGDIRFEDINHKEKFITGEAYAQSKLAQLMFTKSLDRIFKEKKLPIQANAAHPGVVATDLFDHSYLYYFKPISKFLFKTPEEGATSIAFAAVSPKLEGTSGVYISNCREASTNRLCSDQALQDRLFEMSMKQVKLESIPL